METITTRLIATEAGSVGAELDPTWDLAPETFPGAAVLTSRAATRTGFVPNVIVRLIRPAELAAGEQLEGIVPATGFPAVDVATRPGLAAPGEPPDEEVRIAMAGVLPLLQVERWHRDASGEAVAHSFSTIAAEDAEALVPSLRRLLDSIEVGR